MSENETEPGFAGFSERIVAFALDAAPFVVGYLVSFAVAFPRHPLEISRASLAWPYLWTALFVLYQAFAASGGRVSLGKKALGMRVSSLEGQPLGFGSALARALLYPLSAVGGAGFAWALIDRSRQALHDLVVGSVVVRERALSPGFRSLVRAGAVASLALVGTSWMWENVWAARYDRIMTLAYAQVGLEEMVSLQRRHHKRNGQYAEGLFGLASVSDDPKGFLRDAGRLYELERGVDFKVAKDGFVITARARDGRGTRVSVKAS